MTPKRRVINLSWFFLCLCFSKSLLIKYCSYVQHFINKTIPFRATLFEHSKLALIVFLVFNIYREVLCLEFLYCRVLTGSADGKVR